MTGQDVTEPAAVCTHMASKYTGIICGKLSVE